MQDFLKELLSDPKVKEAIHKKMRKLEKKLERLASLYFDQDITIIYAKRSVKVEEKHD